MQIQLKKTVFSLIEFFVFPYPQKEIYINKKHGNLLLTLATGSGKPNCKIK